jgi:hypothetical protein
MHNFIHRPIKRFYLEGQIYDDAFIPRLKEQYIMILDNCMRIKGFVPRIDIDPDFTIEYNGKNYNFKLSVYGIYIGKRNAEKIWAIDKNKPILFTQQSKSDESLQQRV